MVTTKAFLILMFLTFGFSEVVKRKNGWSFITGKNCGIKTSIKYYDNFNLPANLSNLECIMIRPPNSLHQKTIFNCPNEKEGYRSIMAFCFQNCADLLWEKNCNFLRSPEQFIRTVKRQNNFWNRMLFLTYSWRFLRSNTSDQLAFKLKKKKYNLDLETCRKK